MRGRAGSGYDARPPEVDLRDPTGLLQAQPRVVADAAAWLEAYHPGSPADRPLLDQVARMFVARLTGAPIHAETLRRLHTAYSPSTRAQTVEAVASALRAHRLGGDGFDLHRQAVHGLVVPEAAPLDHDDGGGHTLDDELGPSTGKHIFSAGRRTLIDALNDVGPVSAEGEAVIEVTALLRARAQTPEAAVELASAAEQAVLSTQVLRLPSAPDEVVLGATRGLAHGAPDLVRAAQALLAVIADAHRKEVALGVAAVEGGLAPAVAHHAGYVHTLARAAQLCVSGGLVHLDEASFDAASDELAEHPQRPRHVDPDAAFGHDRWELSALLQRPSFLGRQEDVGQLVASLTGAGEGDARLIQLSGPPGIGKTSLLRAAFRAAALDDELAPILWGAADPIQPTPYAPMVGMLRALAGAPSGADRARVRLNRLLRGLGGFLDDEDERELLSLESILAYLIGAGDDEDDQELAAEVDSLSPRSLRVAIRRATLLVVRAMGRRSGGRAPVLVIPGAEAVDVPTRELLAFLARREEGRLVVVLISAAKLRLPKRFTETFARSTFAVGPLPAEEAVALVGSVLDDDLPAEALGPLVSRAKGSPLALHHLARFAIEGGMIRRDGGAWDLSGCKQKHLPGSLDRLLAGRIERLPEDQRRTLHFCAALGHTFFPAAVEIVGVRSGLPREAIARALNLLLQTGFLVRSGRRPGAPVFYDAADRQADPMLAFEHPVLRAAAEASTPHDDRPLIHALAAEATETLLPSGTRAVAAALARHLRLAGEREGAITYLTLATRRAVRLNNTAGATSMAEEGLKLCRPHETEAQFIFQLELEKALEQAGDREGQKDALKQLVRLGEATGEARRQGQALARVARFNVFSGDADKAEQVAIKALERFRFAGDDPGQAQTLRLLALARFERRDLEGALDALSVGREHVPFDDRRSLGIVEHQLGMMRLEAGDAIGALEHLVAARDHKRKTGDLAGEGAVLDAIADAFGRSGRLHVAHEVLAQAVELRSRIGDEAGRAESSKNLGEVALQCGAVEHAQELAQTAKQLARQLGLERLERSATVLAARAALWSNDPKTAEQLIDSVRRRVDEERDPFAAMEAALVSAEAKWARAQSAASNQARERLLATALERARAAAALGESHGYATGQVLGAALIGAVLLDMGDASGALPYSQRACELLDDRSSTALPAEQVWLGHARILEEIGDADDAAEARAQALAQLEARARGLPEASRERFWSPPARAALRAAPPPA